MANMTEAEGLRLLLVGLAARAAALLEALEAERPHTLRVNQAIAEVQSALPDLSRLAPPPLDDLDRKLAEVEERIGERIAQLENAIAAAAAPNGSLNDRMYQIDLTIAAAESRLSDLRAEASGALEQLRGNTHSKALNLGSRLDEISARLDSVERRVRR